MSSMLSQRSAGVSVTDESSRNHSGIQPATVAGTRMVKSIVLTMGFTVVRKNQIFVGLRKFWHVLRQPARAALSSGGGCACGDDHRLFSQVAIDPHSIWRSVLFHSPPTFSNTSAAPFPHKERHQNL